jgi:pimeloyl-ACP methyl ester carboxylesterase
MRHWSLQLTALIGLIVAGRYHPQANLARWYNPPGRLVDIGGRRLHLYCTGKQGPTVILVPGGGAFSVDWALVQPKVAEHTRVCSYDRAGLAWSDSGPADETVEQTVSDLHTLLETAGETPPYLLVGASIGGIYIRAYQHAFPAAVAGLIFSNSSNRVGRLVAGKPFLIWNLTEGAIRSTFPLPASDKGRAPTREGEPFDRLPPTLRTIRLWLDVRLWEEWDPTKATPESTLSWRKEFLREFDETDNGTHPLGNLPVVVLSSRPIASEAERNSRDGAAARLDSLSSNTVHLTATGSDHEIHLYRPDLVVQGLLCAVLAVRNHAPLACS